LSQSAFWGFELALGVLAALVFAGCMIVRQNRANVAHTNLQRLVALEHQAFQDELNIIRHDVACNAEMVSSARKSITDMGNAVLEAIGRIETRRDTLQDRTAEQTTRNEDRDRGAEANEIRQLRGSIERIGKIQKLIEERLSDEIRFSLERAKIADASLKGFANRVETFSERLNGLAQDYNELSAAVGLLKEAGPPPPAAASQAEQTKDSEVKVAAAEVNSQSQIPSANALITETNTAESIEQADGGEAYSSDQAA
jgi:hypothetical protein